MRASAVIALIIFAALAMLGPAFIIIGLPYIPNWPYVGAVCLAASALAGGIYLIAARRYLERPVPVTAAWLLRIFPLWLSSFACFWSCIRLMVEKIPCLEFAHGVVIEKYRSSNHGYLSIRVQVAGLGALEVEGLSLNSWNRISTGSEISKRCGVSDIEVK